MFYETSSVKHRDVGMEMTEMEQSKPLLDSSSDYRNPGYASARANNMFKSMATGNNKHPPNSELENFRNTMKQKSNLPIDPTVNVQETIGGQRVSVDPNSLESVTIKPTGYNPEAYKKEETNNSKQ